MNEPIARNGHAPDGYRLGLGDPLRRPILLHLVPSKRETGRALCGKWITPERFTEYSQRSKCRTCWLKRARLDRQAQEAAQ